MRVYFNVLVFALVLMLGNAVFAEVNTVVIPDPAKKPPSQQERIRKLNNNSKVSPSPYDPIYILLGTAEGVIKAVCLLAGCMLAAWSAVNLIRHLQNPHQYTISYALGGMIFSVCLFGIAYLQQPVVNAPKQSKKASRISQPKSSNVQQTPVL